MRWRYFSNLQKILVWCSLQSRVALWAFSLFGSLPTPYFPFLESLWRSFLSVVVLCGGRSAAAWLSSSGCSSSSLRTTSASLSPATTTTATTTTTTTTTTTSTSSRRTSSPTTTGTHDNIYWRSTPHTASIVPNGLSYTLSVGARNSAWIGLRFYRAVNF
jgi:hypothetical protein